MLVYHPQMPYLGNPVENVFYAADDMGNDIGVGFVMLMYQPHIFPERPVNIYFQMDVQPQARHILLGALMGQAMRLKAHFPGQKTRVYTALSADDVQMIEFCKRNGFLLDDAEDLVSLSSPVIPVRLPMSFEFGAVPLGNEYEQNAFLMRLNAYRVAAISLGMLAAYGHTQRFLAIAVYKNGMPVSEALVAGDGDTAFIGSLYVRPEYRRIGVGRAMLGRVIDIMRREGVSGIDALVLRRSPIQQRLAEVFSARVIRATAIYPGINMD